MIDIRQSLQYANYLKSIGWTVERINQVNYFIRKFPLIGAVIKIQRPEEIRYKDVKNLVKKYRIFQVIIEPKNELDANYISGLGFKFSNAPYLPTKTLQIDLTQSKEKIFKSLKKDTKQAIKKNRKLEIINYNNKLKELRKYWRKESSLTKYVPPLEDFIKLKKTFKKNSFFIGSRDGKSGAILLKSDKVVYYWRAFTGLHGRKNLYQYKIVWDAILWAKKKDAKIFDFEGIYDHRLPNKSWLGFTHFKKSFGGYEISYPGTYAKTRLPFQSWI